MGVSYQKLRTLMTERGVSAYRLIKKEKLIGQPTWDSIAKDGHVNTRTICILCEYFKVQPGDILEYIPEQKE